MYFTFASSHCYHFNSMCSKDKFTFIMSSHNHTIIYQTAYFIYKAIQLRLAHLSPNVVYAMCCQWCSVVFSAICCQWCLSVCMYVLYVCMYVCMYVLYCIALIAFLPQHFIILLFIIPYTYPLSSLSLTLYQVK